MQRRAICMSTRAIICNKFMYEFKSRAHIHTHICSNKCMYEFKPRAHINDIYEITVVNPDYNRVKFLEYLDRIDNETKKNLIDQIKFKIDIYNEQLSDKRFIFGITAFSSIMSLAIGISPFYALASGSLFWLSKPKYGKIKSNIKDSERIIDLFTDTAIPK